MKKGKKLSAWQIAAIVVGGILVLAGITVGIMAAVGVFDADDGIPHSDYRKGGPVTLDKPIVYLYPETNTEVSVKLGTPEKLLVSYPLYEDGWRVLAEPSGKLKDLKTGRELYGLYWEGKDNSAEIADEGFVVAGENTAEFLEEKLALLGLNEREAEEFIVYWLPKLQLNKYNYIRFASIEEIEDYMPLIVTPKPDTTIRIMMIASPLDDLLEVEEQILPPTPERSGFTVVEWGGSITE